MEVHPNQTAGRPAIAICRSNPLRSPRSAASTNVRQ